MKWLIFCILLSMHAPVWAQKEKKSVEADPRLAGVDAELTKVLQTWKAAGFAVAIVEKNKVLYAKGFGTRRAGKNEPVTPNTLFAIGSCTKAFTATLAGKLVAEGKASYDEPIRNYLPALQFFNDEMNQRVSLRHMMSHTTGLPRHDVAWYLNPSDNRDSLIMRIRYHEPTAKPGAIYQYNNFMFLAQGVLVEKLTGKSWEKTMHEQLIGPLGMTRTNMPYEAVKADSNLAAPHAYNKDSTLKQIPHYNIGGMGPPDRFTAVFWI